MNEQNSINELKKLLDGLLSEAQKIVITTHVNPDGDGYCAALALQRILESRGKASKIWMDGDDLSRFDFLFRQDISGADQRARIGEYAQEQDVDELAPDLTIVLDCNSYDRVGQRKTLLDKAKELVVLDHHILEHNPIVAEYALIDPAYVSVGAIIFELYKDEIAALPETDRLYVCNCLYATILNDTNNYANANTNAAVFRFAAGLSELGIKPNVLYKEFFLNHRAEEMRYVGQTLATIELHFQRRILSMFSTLEMSQANQIDPESVMNFTRWVQGVAGVEAIIYLREDVENTFKLSLRSVKLDVNAIAVKYGGGGHRQAAGGVIKGTRQTVLDMLLQDFKDALDAYDQAR